MYISKEKAQKIFKKVCEFCDTETPTFTHYVKYDLSRTFPPMVKDYKQGQADEKKGINSTAASFMRNMRADQRKHWDRIRFLIYGK